MKIWLYLLLKQTVIMIKNIIFDLGGVVIGRDYALRGDRLKSFRFLQGEDFPQFWKDFDNGDASQQQVAEAISEIEGCSVAEADEMITYVRGLYNEFPDTVELIKRLSREGYGLYVLSNMPLEFYNYIKSFEVFRYFDGVAISSIEKMSKPDPRFFRLLLDRYGLLPEESLFVDDKIMNVTAAARLGLHTCLFDAAGTGCGDVINIL